MNVAGSYCGLMRGTVTWFPWTGWGKPWQTWIRMSQV